MQWLYLYFPQLQLDRLHALTPSLTQEPVVIYDAQAKKQIILQQNKRAEEAGLHVGMPLARAWLLAETLTPIEWRFMNQQQQLRQLATHLYRRFSDLYLDSPDGIWIDLQPMRRVYPHAEAWTKALTEQLEPFSAVVKQASHSAPSAARLLARYGVKGTDDILVEQLPCEEKHREKIIRFGIHTLGELKQIPRKEIGRKLGQEVVLMLAQLEGHQRIRLSPYQPPQSFYQRLVLPSEVENWQGLQFSIKRVLQELERFLEGRGKAATELVIRLHFREHPIQSVCISAPHGCVRASEFMSLCQLKMEHEKLQAPAIELSVHAKGWKAHQAVTPELWNKSLSASTPLHQLLNQLQLRMGEERVHAIQNVSYWLPELSWQRQVAGQPIQPAQPNTIQSQRPAWLCLHAQKTDIDEWRLGTGPERIRASGWQTGEESIRDYYQARHQSGRLGWIFYCYRQRCWWLQGWFS